MSKRLSEDGWLSAAWTWSLTCRTGINLSPGSRVLSASGFLGSARPGHENWENQCLFSRRGRSVSMWKKDSRRTPCLMGGCHISWGLSSSGQGHGRQVLCLSAICWRIG